MIKERLQMLSAALKDMESTKQRLVMPEGKTRDKFEFDFSTFGRLEPTCETAACAVGTAALLPEFRALGLGYVLEVTKYYTNLYITYGEPEADEEKFPWLIDSFGNTARFFDITPAEARWLFYPRYYPDGDDTQPEEIAANIDRYIAAIEAGEEFEPLVWE